MDHGEAIERIDLKTLKNTNQRLFHTDREKSKNLLENLKRFLGTIGHQVSDTQGVAQVEITRI